jgi:putative transposase
VFDGSVDTVLKEVCLDIAKRSAIIFLEIGTDKDHVHFLIQSIPTYSPTKIVKTIKSMTAREIFQRVPAVKKQLWGGAFWSKGYFISTVGRHGNEEVIRQYVKQQGSEKTYKKLHRQDVQMELFWGFRVLGFDTTQLAAGSLQSSCRAALSAALLVGLWPLTPRLTPDPLSVLPVPNALAWTLLSSRHCPGATVCLRHSHYGMSRIRQVAECTQKVSSHTVPMMPV